MKLTDPPAATVSISRSASIPLVFASSFNTLISRGAMSVVSR
ncbi:hypothetical protein [Mesorhizobium sp. WSM3868]|nr:hypothetical protein [Mesorhizobium sp. WSM3868]